MTNKEPAYQKHNSFLGMHVSQGSDEATVQALLSKIADDPTRYDGLPSAHRKILDRALVDLIGKSHDETQPRLRLTPHVISEIVSYSDRSVLPRYLVHRYRYEIFPQTRELDSFPPYLQLEPASICNYRCVFCYQVDTTFSRKSSGHMGYMSLDMFKSAVDEIEGNVEFLSLASRGEPLLCPDFDAMMSYTRGKFLNLKVNTNASMLSEDKCHAILQGGCKTLVISADAAKEPQYSELRVNGKLDQVLRNVEEFRDILEKQYPDSELITRVSGVHVSEDQSIEDMKAAWSGLVDQVTFVHYNPSYGHLNVYQQGGNEELTACSDLWRRMFLWVDGRTNPCDVDYKSVLTVGRFPEQSLSDLWQSDLYQTLRESHKNGGRQSINPCMGCATV